MKRVKGIWLVIIALVLALGLEFLQLATQPPMVTYEYDLPEQLANIFPKEDVFFYNSEYIYENHRFIPTGSDSHMVIDVQDAGSIRSVALTFPNTIEKKYSKI